MNKERIIIQSDNKRYLSEIKEFKNGLPHGIVNKVLTDVGGTYCAINCNSNYIVVVPFKDLANSIEADTNNKYNVFKLYGGIYKTKYNDYIANNDIKKIVVTYDSFKKLTSWLKQSGEELNDYKILVDEYHLILEDMDFRDTAINNMIDTLREYKHYTFLSATPINTVFEFDWLKQLKYYEINWGDTIKIIPKRVRTANVYQTTSNLIKRFLSGVKLNTIDNEIEQVKELHIFINSIEGIATICNTTKLAPDQVKIVCAERIRNTMLLDKYSIGSITEPNKPINFYTKKGFQGCNIFSNNGLIVVVSDARKEHMLIDIETTLTQIVGRIRYNKQSKNVFRNKLYHIYSTNRNILSDQEFKEHINNKIDESKVIYNTFKDMDQQAKRIILKRSNFDADFISISDNDVYFNKNKEQLFKYKYELQKVYKDGFTIKNSYSKNSKFLMTAQTYDKLDDVFLSKVSSIKLKDIYQAYINSNDKTLFENEYPDFKDYNKYLTVSEMNSTQWNEKKINELLTQKQLLQLAHQRVANQLTDQFISNRELKQLYADQFKILHIELTAKGTLIEQNIYLNKTVSYSTINGKRTKGYTVTKILYNFNDLAI